MVKKLGNELNIIGVHSQKKIWIVRYFRKLEKNESFGVNKEG